MKVNITALFSKQKLNAYIKKEVDKWEQVVLMRLHRIGQTFVTNARNSGAYKDQTGNLRSSIYYEIFKDGVRVGGDLETGKGGTGTQKARALIRRLERDVVTMYPRGFCLVVVAGMEYALWVEAKGKDVLTGSSFIAKKQLRQAVEEIRKKAA